jgi:hypothetical protein
MPLTDYHDMVKAFASGRPNHPLGICVVKSAMAWLAMPSGTKQGPDELSAAPQSCHLVSRSARRPSHHATSPDSSSS